MGYGSYSGGLISLGVNAYKAYQYGFDLHVREISADGYRTLTEAWRKVITHLRRQRTQQR